ncbi:MAG: flagellar hook-associated protein FlgL [Pseudomonadota bacterium]|nr:flagellar hook-associated protein FlgL [Pseudomonadota bacterium]
MIGRLSTLQFNQSGVSTILDAQAEVARLQEQIGTGRRIMRPSDDPSGSVQLVKLNTELSKIESYQKNIAAVTSALSFEEVALDSANDLLLRARELTIQGQNGTLSQSDKNAIASEIDGLREQLLSIGNMQNADGEYIFAGTASAAPAYDANGVFQGDALVRQINIGEGVRVAQGHSGAEIFEAVNAGLNTFDVLAGLSQALRDNDQETVSARFIDVDGAAEKLSSVRTSVGVRMNWIEDQASLNDNFNLDLQRTISDIQDLDIAEAIGRLQLQMVSLQAAQQTFVQTQNLSLFNYL